jgi:exopolyphosphatase
VCVAGEGAYDVAPRTHSCIAPGPPDLDSVVAAVAYGFFQARSGSVSGDEVPPPDPVPVINIPRRDFRLRTEVTFLLGRIGYAPSAVWAQPPAPPIPTCSPRTLDSLDWTTLVFVDEVDLEALHRTQRLRLTLVDHNRLALRQASLADAVVGVLDHHADDGLYPTAAPRVIETVGSATTLVIDAVVRRTTAAGWAGALLALTDPRPGAQHT